MVRVLILLDDPAELQFLQTVMRKIGFDVEAHQNPTAFREALLRLNPDVLIMTAFGKKIHGVEMCANVKKNGDVPYILLLFAPPQAPVPAVGVDRWIPMPVATSKLVDLIADLCGLDQAAIREKFDRIKISEVEEETSLYIGGLVREATSALKQKSLGSASLSESSVSAIERSENYRKFLAEQPPLNGNSFSLDDVRAQVKSIRAAELKTDLVDLELERRQFVSSLFGRSED